MTSLKILKSKHFNVSDNNSSKNDQIKDESKFPNSSCRMYNQICEKYIQVLKVVDCILDVYLIALCVFFYVFGLYYVCLSVTNKVLKIKSI